MPEKKPPPESKSTPARTLDELITSLDDLRVRALKASEDFHHIMAEIERTQRQTQELRKQLGNE